MDRRGFLAGIAAPLAAVALLLMVLAGSHMAAGQEASRTFRVASVNLHSAGLVAPHLQTYQQRLRELGWVEGQNISTTYRWADGDYTIFRGLVRSIMKTSPDVLIVPCGAPSDEARTLRPDIQIGRAHV